MKLNPGWDTNVEAIYAALHVLAYSEQDFLL